MEFKNGAQRGALLRLMAGLNAAKESGLLDELEGELPPSEISHLRDTLEGLNQRQEPPANLPRWRVSLDVTATIVVVARNEHAALRLALANQAAGKIDWNQVMMEIDKRGSFAELEGDEPEPGPKH